MPESFREGTDDIKAVLFPKADSSRIRGDNQVALHRSKASGYGFNLRMFAHIGRYTLPAGIFRNDVTAVTDVSTVAGLIRLDVVGTIDFAALVCRDIGSGWYLHPDFVSRLSGNFRPNSIGRTSAKNRAR